MLVLVMFRPENVGVTLRNKIEMPIACFSVFPRLFSSSLKLRFVNPRFLRNKIKGH